LIELNTVYNEDCLTFMNKLQSNSIDLIIADPPYNIGQDGGDGWDTIKNYLGVFEEWVKEWQRILKNDGLLYCYCSQEFHADIEMIFRKYMLIQNRMIWCYNNGQRVTSKKFPYSYEPFFLVSKEENNKYQSVRDKNNVQKGNRTKKNKNGKVTITQPNPDGIKYTDVWNIPKLSGGTKHTKHKTEKPLELGRRMLRSLQSCNLVYIPFAGSGSEIINCIELNIDFLATETNKKYIDEFIFPRFQNNKDDSK
jgi:site-specific DNA-methyltransferase (adenine-specific)